ncbi:MAG: hypothetical protein WCL19_09610 [Verrucomicrobiota bacterium]
MAQLNALDRLQGLGKETSHLLGEAVALDQEGDGSLGEAREPVAAFAAADGEAQSLLGEALAVQRRLHPALKTFQPRLAPVIKAVESVR